MGNGRVSCLLYVRGRRVSVPSGVWRAYPSINDDESEDKSEDGSEEDKEDTGEEIPEEDDEDDYTLICSLQGRSGASKGSDVGPKLLDNLDIVAVLVVAGRVRGGGVVEAVPLSTVLLGGRVHLFVACVPGRNLQIPTWSNLEGNMDNF
jgi:hypothetical protein